MSIQPTHYETKHEAKTIKSAFNATQHSAVPTTNYPTIWLSLFTTELTTDTATYYPTYQTAFNVSFVATHPTTDTATNTHPVVLAHCSTFDTT